MSTHTTRKYRIEMEVPRVAREGTTWRGLVLKDSYSGVGDVADYLVSSMELAGIPREQARAWAEKHLRCVPVIAEITNGEPEDMPLGP